MKNKAYPVFIAIFLTTFFIVGFSIGILAPTLIIGTSGTIAYFIWLKTTYKNPVNHKKILPLYLLAVAAQIIHTGEEYIADFPFHLSALFDGTDFDRHFFAIAVLIIAAAIWVLTAYGLIYKNQLANYFLWFFLIGPGLVNGIAHFAFPFLAQNLYFPGLITVLLPTILSIILIRRILLDKEAQ